jgi:hypothetical protein
MRGFLLGSGILDGGNDHDLSVRGTSGGPAGCHADRRAAASHSSWP